MNPSSDTTSDRPERTTSTTTRLRRAGRLAWALLGLAGIVVLAGYALSLLSFVLIPVILALFPATLLVPVAARLKERRIPEAVAALLTVGGALLVFGALVGGMVPVVAEELPEIAESAGEGIAEVDQLLRRISPELGIDEPGELVDTLREQVGEAGDLAVQALRTAMGALETLAGVLLLIVILFFYLKEGRRLLDGLVALLPRTHHRRALEIGDRAWDTLRWYFRGQLLVAFVDALFIGIGLWILGVPLVLPLSLLIFFGGLFPIIGAVATGSLAVLVALAHGGIVLALVVTALVLLVQQLEGNVLEPLILGHVIQLHPLVVLLSITAGWLLLGILGAFLAVPTAAITARTARYLSEEEAPPPAAPEAAR